MQVESRSRRRRASSFPTNTSLRINLSSTLIESEADGMASDASEGSAEHNEYEAAFAIQLAAADPQLAPLCDALLERSWARTLLGDRDGALEDAERAQALLPTRSKVSLRRRSKTPDCMLLDGHLRRATAPSS